MKKDTNRTGLAAELALASECLERGLTVLTPMGDYLPYDIIISNGVKHLKVQVKAANAHSSSDSGRKYKRYTFKTVRSSKQKYDGADVDVFALYFIDTKTWAFIPFSEVSSSTVFFRENEKGRTVKSVNKYSKYLNNWKIFKSKED